MTAILLTGVTGSLGGHLAAALLGQPHPAIYCLVRADDQKAATRRLRERMAEVGADDPERLIALPADLKRHRLGLASRTWNDLADQVSGIYHCAAFVHLTADYQRLAPRQRGGHQGTGRAGHGGRRAIELPGRLSLRLHPGGLPRCRQGRTASGRRDNAAVHGNRRATRLSADKDSRGAAPSCGPATVASTERSTAPASSPGTP